LILVTWNHAPGWSPGPGRHREPGVSVGRRDDAALKAFKAAQAREQLAAGPVYTATGYVLVDELGAPQRTDWLRRQTYKAMATAMVRKVRAYDARHACLTYLAVNGVPATIVSAWAGHSDLSLVQRVYVHPSARDLEQGRDALAILLG
jgi:integrase